VPPSSTHTVDVDIEYLDANGDGVAQHRGVALTIPFVIPGERVRLQLDRPGAASVVSILRASPHRVTPTCRHFGPCGGCAWQHIAYPEQLALKTALVQRLVRETVPRARAVLPTLAPCPPAGASAGGRDPQAPWGYRQKVHFVFSSSAGTREAGRFGGLVMGHYARGSRRVVPVQECPVHDERGNALAFALKASLDKTRVQAAAPPEPRRPGRGRARPGVLRSVAIRVALKTAELLATVVVTDDGDRALRTATRRLLDGAGSSTSLHVNLHPRQDAFIFGPETKRISGQHRLREEVAGTAFLISPTAFFQTNVRAAEALVRLVMSAVPEDAPVVDLYAGAGLFALPLARAGHRVLAIEENRAAVADGEVSRRLNRLEEADCRFVAQPVEIALRRLPSADVVVLDPPRSGCSPEVLDELRRLHPGTIVYVSCNPEALARDLGVLTRGGFTIRSIQPVDMFPHTAHVETVVVIGGRSRR
jgi:23S rRNA (uracil1939-C5)-methyltransferase